MEKYVLEMLSEEMTGGASPAVMTMNFCRLLPIQFMFICLNLRIFATFIQLIAATG